MGDEACRVVVGGHESVIVLTVARQLLVAHGGPVQEITFRLAGPLLALVRVHRYPGGDREKTVFPIVVYINLCLA